METVSRLYGVDVLETSTPAGPVCIWIVQSQTQW